MPIKTPKPAAKKTAAKKAPTRAARSAADKWEPTDREVEAFCDRPAHLFDVFGALGGVLAVVRENPGISFSGFELARAYLRIGVSLGLFPPPPSYPSRQAKRTAAGAKRRASTVRAAIARP